MSGSRRSRAELKGNCFWCGAYSDPLTEDHVPPKLIFPPRVHSMLPIVGACDPCNREWQKEAEYFRDFLLTGALATCTHPELVPIREKFLRAQARREGSAELARSVFVPTPFTIVLEGQGSGPDFRKLYKVNEVNLKRIGGVVVRSILAIHYRLMARAVLAGRLTEIPPFMPEGYTMSVCDVVGDLYDKAIAILNERGRSDFGDGLLKWIVYGADESPEHEFLLSLYDKAVFHVRIHKLGVTELVSPLFDGHRYGSRNIDIPRRTILVPEVTSARDAVRSTLQGRGQS